MSFRPLSFKSLLLAPALLAGTAWGGPIPNIIVDQFGYRTASPKVVVFAQPSVGTGSPSSFTPGATFEVRRVSDNAVVFTGNTVQWDGGAVHSQSGDRAWQGAFGAFTTAGSYYISVPGGSNPGSQSYPFQISDSIYNGLVTVSQRSFYYQRCGTAVTAGHGGAWFHSLCHSAANQDPTAHLWNASDQGQARAVQGGWHDAGDYAKYITFVPGTLWYLMHSVEWYPLGYTDATNIPESGNGVPDMLDEVKWELDWLLRMQRSSDGALYSMVGNVNGSGTQGDPVGDTSTRYYTNVSTSATAVGAMAFALGSRLLGAYPAYTSYAVTLQNAAVSAWSYLAANPAPVNYNHTGILNANANVGATADLQLRVGAAAELFHLTGNAAYRTYFDTNYNSPAAGGPITNPPTAGNAFSPDGSEPLQLGMISYCLAPGATGSVVSAIGNALKNECDWYMMGNNPGTSASGDPYMGFMWDGHYTWGSNQLKAAWGNQLLFAVKLGIGTTGERAAYLAQAEEYLHYFHGRNPLNWVYLTNMGAGGANLGASKSVRSIFHSWFWQGTTYDGNTGAGALGPAPGILVGGPNQFYAPDPSYVGTISPPQGQPPMKAYKDWGNTWPENSWEVTENSQGYQGKYQFLLSAFAANAVPTPTATPTATGTLATSTPTQTPTSSPTRTSSPTPTATTCVILLNGAEALGENGTWSGSNAAHSIAGAGTAPVGSITQGVSVLRANVTTAAGWNDQVFNLEGFSQTDWSQVVQFKMDIYVDATLRTGATYSQLFIRADSNPVTWYQPISNDTPVLATGPNLDVTFNIDWAAGVLTSGMPITKLTFIYNNDSSVGTGSFWVDNIRLITTCASTPTSTPSRTPTPTATYSATASPTPTASMTPSHTPSATASLTASSTATRTPTPSASPTSTLTVGATLTSSPTPTLTPTGTPTMTPSATPTSTHTFSPTVSPTPTNSPTGTLTPVMTPTSTLTPTSTSSLTVTATASHTPTLSPSPSSTATPSTTPTSTATSTGTLPATPTTTSTSTHTLTSTPSSTGTSSPSPTSTLPVPPTFTSTPTLSSTPTRTASPTHSPTATPSATSSSTFTATPTATRTASVSATATGTSTASATPTPPTGVATPGTAPLILQNPVQAGTVGILPQSYGGLSDVTVSLYTTAFKLVATKKFPSIPAGQIVTVDLVDRWGQTLANGLYYLSVATKKDKKTVTLLVLR